MLIEQWLTKKSLTLVSMFLGLSITNIGIVNAEDSKFEQTPIVAGEIEDFDLSNLKQIIKKIEKRADEKGSRGETSVRAAGSASGISYFEIIAIGSSNAGWEDIDSWQTTTNLNHGGSLLRK